jgi:hypothetical protein
MGAGLFIRENGLFRIARSLAKKVKMLPLESYGVLVRVQLGESIKIMRMHIKAVPFFICLASPLLAQQAGGPNVNGQEFFNPLLVMLFFVVWVSAAIFQFSFFNKQSAAFKRKYFPRVIIIGGFVFLVFMLALFKWHFQMLVVFLPAIALISYGNLKITRFCDKCGRTVRNADWFSKMDYCPKCGSKLQE